MPVHAWITQWIIEFCKYYRIRTVCGENKMLVNLDFSTIDCSLLSETCIKLEKTHCHCVKIHSMFELWNKTYSYAVWLLASWRCNSNDLSSKMSAYSPPDYQSIFQLPNLTRAQQATGWKQRNYVEGVRLKRRWCGQTNNLGCFEPFFRLDFSQPNY